MFCFTEIKGWKNRGVGSDGIVFEPLRLNLIRIRDPRVSNFWRSLKPLHFIFTRIGFTTNRFCLLSVSISLCVCALCGWLRLMDSFIDLSFNFNFNVQCELAVVLNDLILVPCLNSCVLYAEFMIFILLFCLKLADDLRSTTPSSASPRWSTALFQRLFGWFWIHVPRRYFPSSLINTLLWPLPEGTLRLHLSFLLC